MSGGLHAPPVPSKEALIVLGTGIGFLASSVQREGSKLMFWTLLALSIRTRLVEPFLAFYRRFSFFFPLAFFFFCLVFLGFSPAPLPSAFFWLAAGVTGQTFLGSPCESAPLVLPPPLFPAPCPFSRRSRPPAGPPFFPCRTLFFFFFTETSLLFALLPPVQGSFLWFGL